MQSLRNPSNAMVQTAPVSPGHAFATFTPFIRLNSSLTTPRRYTHPHVHTRNRTNITCTNSDKSSQTPTKPDTDFSKWATSAGIKMPHLLLTHFSSSVPGHAAMRGLSAIKPIKKGTNLLSAPAQSVLQVTTMAEERAPKQFPIPKAKWRTLPWYVRLALGILNARLDKDHPLHDWTKRLPTSVDVPHHWSESDLRQLQNDSIRAKILKQRLQNRQYFQDILKTLPKCALSFEDFQWAVDCVLSRAFSGPLGPPPFKERLRLLAFIIANAVLWPSVHVLPWENAVNGALTALFALAVYDVVFPRIQRIINGVELKRYAMVPGMDMLNHNSEKAGDALVEFRYFTDSYQVDSGRDYNVDDQVFISYGAQSNDAFLQYYGFMDDANTADTFVFDDVIANQLGMRNGRLIARTGGFDREVLNGVLKRVADRDKSVMILRETCRAQLQRFDTTIAEDTQILDDCGADDWRLRTAVTYRRGKKMLLSDIIENWDGAAVRPVRK